MHAPLVSRVLIASAMGLSGFLSFQVQPVMAKFILPWFGGSATTWTVCMLFFQVSLLLGYAFAYVSTRLLGLRAQAILQIAILVAACLFLPITPDAAFKPIDSDNPVGRILLVLVASVGVPYVVLSSTSPLLQRWLAALDGGSDVSRYFAISNLGSFLGLLSYPFVFERLLSSPEQTRLWSVAFVVCCILYGLVALLALRRATGAAPVRQAVAGPPVTTGRIGLWIGLSALGSVLLLSTTNAITQWTAVIPFLWVLPLSVYLLTFVVAFGRQGFYRRVPFLVGFVAAAAVSFQLSLPDTTLALILQLGLQALTMFLGCMICHGEMVATKPDDERLPGFYLAIAVGGAAGGLLVTFVAPVLFRDYWEHQLVIGAIAVTAAVLQGRAHPGAPARVPAGAVAVLAVALMLSVASELTNPVIDRIRNFYGVVKVVQEDEDDPRAFSYVMQQAGVDQGSQFRAADRRKIPACAFGAGSGLGVALQQHRKRREGTPDAPLRIGVIGLGAGMIAASGKPGDAIRYYEINPAVTDLARRHFSFLQDSAASIEVLHGDGRILLEREGAGGASQRYDVLVIDAFRGGSPPLHLMTKEAFDAYLQHLSPDGILAINFELDTFEMAPLHRGLARAFGLDVGWFETREAEFCEAPVAWALYTRDKTLFAAPAVAAARSAWVDEAGTELLWTDKTNNLMSILKWK